MNIEYKSLSGRLCLEGNDILTYRIEFPCISELEEINTFYLSVAEQCQKYCVETLFPLLCEKYGDTRKKHTYRLVCRVTHCDEEFLSVGVYAFIRLGSQKIFENFHANTWELSDRCLFPPKMLCKRKLVSKEFKRMKNGEFEGMLLNRGELCNIRDTDIKWLI